MLVCLKIYRNIIPKYFIMFHVYKKYWDNRGEKKEKCHIICFLPNILFQHTLCFSAIFQHPVVCRLLFWSNTALVYFTDSGRVEDLISEIRWWSDWLEQSPAILWALMTHSWEPLLHTNVFTQQFYSAQSTMLPAPCPPTEKISLCPNQRPCFHQ